MFYDNGSYMQDLNYYNQNPIMNQNFGYNPYMMNSFQNQQFPIGMGMQNQQNLKSMYPATYRVICPVVSLVVSNTNTQYITEDSLNNMVDTVYNIVEGDVSSLISTQNPSIQGDDTTQKNSNINTNNNRSQAYTNNSSTSGRSSNGSADNQTNPNVLLKDLIKILLIKELIIRRNMNSDFRRQQNMQTGNYNYLPYGI